MATLTALILAKNEERHISECVASVAFADEVLVIDDFSTDATVALAQASGARVVTHALNGDWSQQRNFAVGEATGDWILFVDADERISPPLADEIRKVIHSGDMKAYELCRYNVFRHNKAVHGSLRPDRVLRLMPKEGLVVEGNVHETIKSPYPYSRLHGKMYHYTYESWDQYFTKFNRYTTLAAVKYKEQGKSCSFFRDILVRPAWAFFKIYILQKGFLDGKIGFVLSMNHCFYTLTKYAKLYWLLKDGGEL